jgi:hypothetical protein
MKKRISAYLHYIPPGLEVHNQRQQYTQLNTRSSINYLTVIIKKGYQPISIIYPQG